MSAPPPSSLGVWIALGSVYFIWGSTYLAIRYAIESFPPFIMTGVRVIVAGALLLAWSAARHGAPQVGVGQWVRGIATGTLLFGAGQGALAWAELRVDSGVASLFMATVPLWMTVFQTALPGQRSPARRGYIGIGLGVLGLLILANPNTSLAGVAVDPLGAMVLLFSAFAWAAGSAIAKTRPEPGSPMVAAAVRLIGGGITLVAAGLLIGEGADLDPLAASARSWISFGYLTIVGSLVAFAAYQWLLDRMALTTLSTHTFVNPVVALLLGVLVGGEAFAAGTGFAATLIVAAVVVTLRAESGTRPAMVRRPSP